MRLRQRLLAVIAVAVVLLLQHEDFECHVAVLAAILAAIRVACLAAAVGEADVTCVAETAATSFQFVDFRKYAKNYFDVDKAASEC